jgi:hypothetical protein
MSNKLIFGRTKPDRSTKVRQWLKDRVETLSGMANRVKPLHTLFTWNPKVEYENELPYRCCPLPPIELSDGTRPFAIFTSRGHDWIQFYGGSVKLDGLNDPRITPLWHECITFQPTRGCLGFSLDPPEWIGHLLCYIDLHTRHGAPEVDINLDFSLRESDPDGIAKFVSAIGLKQCARAEELNPKPSSTNFYRIEFPGISPDPDMLDRMMKCLDQRGWTDPQFESNVTFIIGNTEQVYREMRPRLNAITRAWNCDLWGTYQSGFDPFLAPPFPPEGEAYRFPVALYQKGSKDPEEPTIQVDMIHTSEGSFLEFLTGESEKVLRRYVDLAHIEVDQLEIWRGPAADRWGI